MAKYFKKNILNTRNFSLFANVIEKYKVTMILKKMRLSNFQSFGEETTEIQLDKITYLIGPNGSGKTAVLQALCKMFSVDPSIRRLKKSDFHVSHDESETPDERKLWIEADFELPEAADSSDHTSTTIPPMFNHMRLSSITGLPIIRYRLEATMGIDGDIDDPILLYVLEFDHIGNPTNTSRVPRSDRNQIQIHYLPAKRDPSEHVAFSTNALLGRLLRSVNWSNEREQIKTLTDEISNSLSKNGSVDLVSSTLKDVWKDLHKGNYFTDPKVNFSNSEIEALLRHMSVSFSPGHNQNDVDFSQLSDGQKSMLYLSLVLTSQAIGRKVLSGEDATFDPDKLNPPIFTIVALEEPENSLSPHFLGRIVSSLNRLTSGADAQALIATHAPSILKRVEPENIRYLRLGIDRQTKISCITLPHKSDEAHKFVRQAVQAYPEIYFSRLVILGEGDSEEIVIPRLLQAKGIPADEFAITIAPLGGRHVNHFWRLLTGLNIPHITLLDLDIARYHGGWGRIKYVNDQFAKYTPSKVLPQDFGIPSWNDVTEKVRNYPNYIEELEKRGVFFSSPLDLDFSMLKCFPQAFNAKNEICDDSTFKAVLGKAHFDYSQYTDDEQLLFSCYHKKFNLGSKPANHIEALANLSDTDILNSMPESYSRMIDATERLINELPE